MKLPIGATIATGVSVCILLGLGTWQIQRLHWKNDLISRLEAEYSAPDAAILNDARLSSLEVEETPLAYGQVSGTINGEKSILLGPKTENGRIGYHLITPMAADGDHMLLINAGWVSDLWKDTTEERLAALPKERVTVRGLIHKPDWTAFTSKNSPANDLWFRADIAEITKAKDLSNAYPFILYADKVTPELQDVAPHEERWLPRNKHLQYAIFWYAMAGVLIGVYAVYLKNWKNKSG